jgi:hypothetical protein
VYAAQGLTGAILATIPIRSALLAYTNWKSVSVSMDIEMPDRIT